MQTRLVLLLCSLLLCAAACAQTPAPKAPADPNDPANFVREGQRLTREGKYDEAVATLQKAIARDSNLRSAQAAMGTTLDLAGRYEEARIYLRKSIELATPEQKARALRDMAMSYAFEKNAKEAAKYEQQAIDGFLAKQPPDYLGAADVTNEMARLYIESGDLDNALKAYRSGWEAVLKTPDLKPEVKALWQFRWENAQARIAARRGNKAEAQQHVTAAKAAMDAMSEADKKAQQPYWPYLTGYVAFYLKDYKTAIADLAQGNQDDPFILVLEAQAHEKAGDKTKAEEFYKKVLTINAHNPTGAFSRPLAKQKLGIKG